MLMVPPSGGRSTTIPWEGGDAHMRNEGKWLSRSHVVPVYLSHAGVKHDLQRFINQMDLLPKSYDFYKISNL